MNSTQIQEAFSTQLLVLHNPDWWLVVDNKQLWPFTLLNMLLSLHFTSFSLNICAAP